jgi:hypothetical protein
MAAALAAGIAQAQPALAAPPAAPHWSIVAQSQPSYFTAGDTADAYRLIVRNDGAGSTLPGDVVQISDTLPAGVTATKVTAVGEGPNGSGRPKYEMTCPEGSLTGTVTCSYEEGPLNGPVLPGAVIVMRVTVAAPLTVPAEAHTLGTNEATVSGGGAPSATTSEATQIDAGPVPFGLSYFDLDMAEPDGETDTQAGSHPYELTASLAFNVSSLEAPAGGNAGAPLANASPKDLELELPPGLVGDPAAVPRCSQAAFLEREELNCPLDTQVGTVKPYFYGRFPSAVYPVYDIVPPPGQPAELGFSVARVDHVPIFFHVRSEGDYGLTMQLADIPEAGPLQGAILSLWGVPAEAGHDLEREGTLGEGGREDGETCKPSVEVSGGVETRAGCPSDAPAKPFLTLPSECTTSAITAGVLSDSWQEPGPPLRALLPSPIAAPAITGCERLAFDPSLSVTPETTEADSPSGYTIDVHMPQDEDPTGLSTPALHEAVVSLPAGVVLSPSAASGLQGCSEAQFGLEQSTAAACPAQSQIGTVKITTPWLSNPLEGELFLARPECEPCTATQAQEGKLVRLLVQAQGAGVIAKLEGTTAIDQGTGQLTVTFAASPQLPLEDIELTLNGGSHAPLANTASCGVPLAASSSLTPYGSETPAQPASAPFELSGCPAPQFHPTFVAGTSDNQAGAFSPLSVTLSRSDQDEQLERLTAHLPPGLLAMISKVALCPPAGAQAGACGPQSAIGTATVAAGPDPLFLAGSVYLTGPHDGAPFGLAIVVPVIAGPLDLGTLEIGAALSVNPSTAALTISSDPLPASVDGIPLQLKTVNLEIDREGFVFNPTDCQPLIGEGVLQSSEGATAAVASRFQAADCATLRFKPKLTALAHAKTGKADGAYLHVRLEFPPGGANLAQANLAQAKVDLPKQLTARLGTLQHACPAAVIAANPAGCDAASVVGSSTVITPLLRGALAGPVYLVSRGAGASPELELVLQGEGVTLDVLAQTSVQHGIIAAAFRALPDVPISTLGLVLDEGAHSLLDANLPASAHGSLCGQRLEMPTLLTAQDGAQLKQDTRIGVSGCKRRRA